MILNRPGILLNRLPPILLLLLDLKKRLSRRIMLINVPDLKVHKLNLVCIGLSRTQVPLCGLLEVSGLFDGDVGFHSGWVFCYLNGGKVCL